MTRLGLHMVNKAHTIHTSVDEFPSYMLEYLIENYCAKETFHTDMEQVARRRETGKTYSYRNISYYAHVLSGGKATPAQLFINLNTGKIGEVGTRDASSLMRSPTPTSPTRKPWSVSCRAICRMPGLAVASESS
jgi:predicted ATP-dependent Lon-type protease